MKIYLAHPISGMSADEVFDYYDTTNNALRFDYEVLYPMLGKGYMRNEVEFKAHGYDNMPVSTNHAIMNRDQWMVDQCDILFLDFTGAKSISIGCCMELAWAKLLKKHTVVVLDKDNIHKHAFVLECAHVIFETYDEAISYLIELANH